MRKSSCRKKGYADGVKFAKSKDQKFVSEEFKKNMDKGMSAKDAFDEMIKSHQKQGYAYGTKKMSPMGYYLGTEEVTPQQQQQLQAFQAPTVVQAQAPAQEPTVGQEAASMMGQELAGEAAKPVTEAITGQAKEALSNVKAAFDPTKEISKVGLGESAVAGMGGAVASDLLTKGKVDEKTLLKGGLAMGANMLLPGSGMLVGPALSALGLQDGTMEVPPMGYADGSRFAMAEQAKSEMSPEEYQKDFINRKIKAPLKQFAEDNPLKTAPLFMLAAADDFNKGEMRLGKFGGGVLEGGKDRLAYRHKKYGDFEINPESERVSYKKTFRF
jgi:hypothetical protein